MVVGINHLKYTHGSEQSSYSIRASQCFGSSRYEAVMGSLFTILSASKIFTFSLLPSFL